MLRFRASALARSTSHQLPGMGSWLPASEPTNAWALGPALPSCPVTVTSAYGGGLA